MLRKLCYLLMVVLAGSVALPSTARAQSAVLWQQYFNAALEAEKENNWKKAIRLHRVALKEAEGIGPKERAVVISAGALSRALNIQGKYDEAGKLARRQLDIVEEHLGPNSPALAGPLEGLASIYTRQGKYELAEPLYKRCLEIHEKAPGYELNVVGDLANLAVVKARLNQFAEAEKLSRRAMKILEDRGAADKPVATIGLGVLADVYLAVGKFTQAEALYKRCLAITEPDADKSAVARANVPSYLIKLAEVAKGRKKYDESDKLYKRALEGYERVYGKDHKNVGITLLGIADLKLRQGQPDQAAAPAARGLAILNRLHDETHPDVATALELAARVACGKRAFADSERLHKQALEARKEVYGEDHLAVAASQAHLADLYLAMGKLREAEPLYKRAVEVRLERLSPEHPEVADTLDGYAHLLRKMGRTEEARKYAEQARALRALARD